MINLRKRGRDVYMMQDTHWNMIGATECVNYLNEYLGFDVDNDYEVTDVPAVGGDLAQMIAYPGDEYVIYSTDYKKNISVAASHEVGRSIITSNLDTDRKCIFVGDSFRDYMGGMLAKSFSKTTIFHNKTVYGGESDSIITPYFEELKPGDHIIYECIERATFILPWILEALTKYIGYMPN